jgi:hypothetical protein
MPEPVLRLIVIQCRVTDRRGISTQLAAAVQVDPDQLASPVLAAIALHLADLRDNGCDPVATDVLRSLRGHVPGLRPYVYRPLHDPRVEYLLDLDLHPRDTSGWPTGRLALLEHGTDPAPWGRTRRCSTVARILELAALEVESTTQHLASRSRSCRTSTDGLLDQVLAAARRAAAEQLHQPAPAAVDNGCAYSTEPVPGIRVLTGAIVQEPESRTADGQPVVRLLLAPDQPPMVNELLLERLVLTLRGDNATAAASSLTAGSHLIVTGALRHVRYTGADSMPHTAFTFDVEHLGYALH